jgi:hypothetical protein
MELSVGITPQAVFPFGEQDSFGIRNNGPWTIYVDQDSTVSENTSHAVPPTGVLAWDQDRPLFMVCSSLAGAAGSSNVQITRNTSVSQFNNFVDSVLFRGNIAISSSTPIDSGKLECAAYDAITLGLECSDMEWGVTGVGSLTTAKAYAVSVVWYDGNGNALYKEGARLPGYADPNHGIDPNPISKATFKVRGAFARFYITVTGGPFQVATTVTGTTRDERPGMSWYATDVYAFPDNVNIAVQGWQDAVTLYFDALASAGPYSFVLPTRYRNMRATFASLAGAGVAGSMSVRDATDVNTYNGPTVALPVGSSRTVQDWVLPLYHPQQFLVIVPSGPIPATQRCELVFWD